jgi:hypothetical protein
LYDVTLTEMGNVIYQFWGSTLVGIGLLAWFVRDIDTGTGYDSTPMVEGNPTASTWATA